jgi:hypothetical protein
MLEPTPKAPADDARRKQGSAQEPLGIAGALRQEGRHLCEDKAPEEDEWHQQAVSFEMQNHTPESAAVSERYAQARRATEQRKTARRNPASPGAISSVLMA